MKKPEPKKTPTNLTENQKRFLAFDLSSLNELPYEPKWEDLRQELCQKLTDDELAAILSVPDLDLASLFWNVYLYWDGRRFDKEPPLQWPKAIASYLTNVAFAINNSKTECLGRLTDSWFKPHVWVQEGTPYWMGQYKKTLLGDDHPFPAEFVKLQESWPPKLNEFRNMAIPQWPGHIVNLHVLAETYLFETVAGETQVFECDAAFLRKARTFVQRWNLEKISFRDGKWDFVPAKICCVSEVDGQGTFIFIPRYYKWDDFRNHIDADFKHLHDLIEKTYARFESSGNKKGRKKRAMIAHVKQGLGNQKATAIRVFKFVDEWLAKQGYKGQDQRRTYRNMAREEFKLPESE